VRLRLAGSALVCVVLLAEQAADPPSARFSLDTTLVLIPATVTDPMNRFVLGLHKDDFHLYEDGVEQTIANLSGEDAPLSGGPRAAPPVNSSER
jgi:hypothetical protein